MLMDVMYHVAMNAIAFDTLKLNKTLKQSGFSDAQAKAVVSAFAEVTSTSTAGLATKADVQELDARITSSLRELELRMTSKLGGMLVVLLGILLTALKFFF